MKILVTGVAGFIGFYVCKRLLDRGDIVVGLDNINTYYDVGLKYGRLSTLGIQQELVDWYKFVESNFFENFRFIRMNLEDKQVMQMLFANEHFDKVVNLAAQAGVRYSLENPYAYVESNIDGFLNVLEGCRHYQVKHLVYASSSSVYGLNGKVPFSEKDSIAHPVSLYAATKKSNELMAHTYSHLYGIPSTGLRFFTVYGPWGRPDMSPFLFTDAMLHGRAIKVFNHGDILRDFTYIDDIVEGVLRVIDHIPVPNPHWSAQAPDPSSSTAPYKIYNIGNSHPVKLMDFIQAIEEVIGHPAEKVYLPMQPGDVYQTDADTTALQQELGFKPNKSIKDGVRETVEWYRSFYKL
ncbi:NAD-dependent epimerase [Bacteroides uniformis]|jgi:UDP-glucuronate 4-epimerase|uniref:NAD-dependent epimerase n=1 Tax=Bacteroides uniformis TaxID=820 RepID=UPI0018977BA7|nr:NAD-dependent epimerase [Bacteroides uniformis]MDC1997635.1 NAD-dependent epimerase [Bacteroides uniformis]MDC2001441.1 NAD-dependent epimerase [Bacteroides uniformis]MDC2005136.1 NAD-dependent epimerase [Bacteroides uniformis]